MTAMTVGDLRPVALWAADCAERALRLYEDAVPGNLRVRNAIEGARGFGLGRRRDKRMRTLAFAALAAAGDIDDPGAKAAARQTMHLLAPAVSAAQARELATSVPAAADTEIDWAREHCTGAVRVVVTQMPDPAAGRTRLGDLYRALDTALRHPPGTLATLPIGS